IKIDADAKETRNHFASVDILKDLDSARQPA
ncbi:acyl carrier protein, partial [Pseudomonas syringae pv. tagetis]